MILKNLINSCLLPAALFAAGNSFAEESMPHMAIGYTGEELPSSGTLGISHAGTIMAAMQVDPSEIGNLSDLKITGFDVGITSRINVTSLSVWARESLDAEPIISVTLQGKPEKGWNSIPLSQFIEIDCKPFFIGYTIETSGASYPVATAGESYANCLWINNGDNWENLSNSGYGMLAMSVTISAPDLPFYNLTLVDAEIPPVLHSVSPTQIPIEVRNSGAMPVTGFSVTCSEGNGLEQTFEMSSLLEPNERLKTVLEVMPLSPESEKPFEFTVTISSIADGKDSNMSDNSISAMTRISRFTFTKRLLVEEFTTMLCVNCPRAAKLLHQALEIDRFKNKVLAVCHHSGFYTDYLTQPCDEEMLVLYGNKGNFAPAICYNRMKLDDGAVVGNFPVILEGLSDIFDTLLDDVADVDLNISAAWNESKKMMDIHVEGGCVKEEPPVDANRITVYVLENNINTPTQAGGDMNYMQQHVIRAYNATWGEEINWNSDGKFYYNVSLSLPDDIKVENIEVIGLISHYNSQDPLDCRVANTARAANIDWNGDAKSDLIQNNDIILEEYFDLMGNRVSRETGGIILKTIIFSDGSFKTIKIKN